MAPKPPRVLVVDDDRAVLEWMASLLEAAGMEVLRGETGEEALRRARERPPAVAVLDIRLPGLSGREVCRILKEEPRFGRPLVMHVTGVYTRPEEAARALSEDADDYLVHPLDPSVFVARVRALLRLKATEEALREEAERRRELEAIVNRSPAVAFLWRQEPGWPVVFVSENVSRWGYRAEEFLSGSRPFVSLLHPEDRPRLEAELAAFRDQGKREFLQVYRIVTADGRVRWVEDRTVVRAGGAGPALHEGILLDVTEAREAQAERLLLWTAIEEGDPVVIVTDADANIRYVNPAFERLTGYAKGEVLGKNPRLLQSGRHDRAFYESLWKELTAGRTWRGTFVNRRKDGSLYHEAAVISPVRDASGRTTAYVAVKQDVTRERELEERARTAEEMARLGRLVQGLAHEIRNPLFAIEVNAALLERTGPLGPEAEQALRFVREHVGRLNALLKDILELGVSGGEEALTECTVRSLLEEAVSQLASVLPQAAARVTVQAVGLERPVRVLRHGVVRALYHLLKNAAEADPHGEIVLAAAEEEGAAVLRVLDRGPGLPPELGEKIFEPFVSGKAGQRGLGLALARRYTERSRGTLSAENRHPPPGAAFTVRLPLGS